MKLFINNIETSAYSNNLSDILKEKEFLEKKGIAVAINNSVVPKSEWTNTKLNENDKILIITATQGG